VNYCRFRNATRGNHWQSEAEDVLTGTLLQIRSRAVVNATGPWSDGLPHSRVKLRLTKGIHLVVHRSRLSVPDTVVMTEGQRILFAIPWGERTILGTTDTDYAGAPENVTVAPGDTDYILNIANKTFPGAKLAAEDVISSWAGVRPLLADLRGGPSDISRAHEIKNPEPCWWDVAGGKLTTYRLMAEQTVDAIRRELGLPRLACPTAGEPLLPADETPGFSSVLPPEFSRAAVEHFVRNEWAVHLDDVLVRRASWLQYGTQNANAAAAWMAEILAWSPEHVAAEIDRCRQLAGWTSSR
jgi:glycerol-3-phosphate dehydrogenase